MLSLANIYTLYYRLYIFLNKLSFNKMLKIKIDVLFYKHKKYNYGTRFKMCVII